MSTDSTELTFVRCPSCRSLVPAISTRCRMCGATLEAVAAVDGGDQEPRKSGRVRQRTMSDASSEMSSAIDFARDPQPADSTPQSPPSVATSKCAAPDLMEDDPLSGYLEEEDIEEESEEKAPTPVAQVASSSPTAPAIADDETDDDSSGEESHASLDDLLELGADDPLAEFTKPPAAEEPPVAPPAPEAAAPRVVVETGGRRGDRPSQLNFGAPKDKKADETPARHPAPRGEQERPREQAAPPRQQPQEQRPRQEARPPQTQQQSANNPRPAQQSPGQQNRPQNQPPQNAQPRAAQPQTQQNGAPRPQAGGERQQQGDRRPQPTQPPVASAREESRPQPATTAAPARPDQALANQRRGVEEKASQPVQPSAPAVKEQRAPAFHPGAAKVDLQVGRLFGWFVNYSDPNGAAMEIREGKFFLSSKSVKPNDMVIEDRTISAPHALLNVSASGGLIVQDLMSERGVHIRRKGSDTYRREEEPVGVTHGDWVRFGDVEFLVSLIAFPGEN